MIPLIAQTQSSSLDFALGIDRSFRVQHLDDKMDEIYHSRKQESAILNYHFGLHFNYPLSQRLFLRTGLRYTKLGYSGKHYDSERWDFRNMPFDSWQLYSLYDLDFKIDYDYAFI